MYQVMAKTFMINQLMIRSKSMMKSEKLQQEKEMITQLVFTRLSILQISLPVDCS